MSTGAKFAEMILAIGIFGAIFAAIIGIAGLSKGRSADRVQGLAFVAPAVILIAVGLIYPAVSTIYKSFKNGAGTSFVGLDNYKTLFTQSEYLVVLRNTFFWVLFVPVLATAVGLLYAVVIDKARVEALAKALVFLPMAISFVGASIIWKFVYDFRGFGNQIGLLNEILVKLHIPAQNWLLLKPANNFCLIVVMIWIQAGFAMTVLSAAIKAIPEEITEAARLDGVGGIEMFRFVTVPSIRPAIIVVLTTIGIGTLKVFDIVRTMTGGQFSTSVVANEFFSQLSRGNEGLGASLAVILFILVVPIVAYNVRQLRKADAR